MKSRILVFIALLMCIALYARWSMEWQDGNEFVVSLTNYGIVAHDVLTGDAGGFWPSAYPGENYIYGSGLLFGGIVDGNNDGILDTLVSVGYNPQSEFVPGEAEDKPLYSNKYERVYNSSYAWPPRDYYGYVIHDSIVSVSDMYAAFSDLDASQHFTNENYPIGIVVHMSSYTLPGTLMNNTVIIRCIVKNVRHDNQTIHDAYAAWAYDMDIGNESGSSANDLIGFIDTLTYNNIKEHISTVYQFQTDSEPGWHDRPGIPSVVLLETPIAQTDIDLYHDGSYIIPAGDPIGLTAMGYYSLATFPSTKEERYQVLAGYDHMNFNPSDPEAYYMPFPQWGQGMAGYPGQTQSESGDKRFSMSTGPFDIAPGDSIIYTFALIINEDSSCILYNAQYIKDIWYAARNNTMYELMRPSFDETITGAQIMNWTGGEIADSVLILLRNNYVMGSSMYTFVPDWGFYNFDPSGLADGWYAWTVYGYKNNEPAYRSRYSRFLLDQPSQNGVPIANTFDYEIIDDYMHLFWNTVDVEGEPLKHTIDFTLYHSYGEWHGSADSEIIRTFTDYDDSLLFKFRHTMPEGLYTIRLIASDLEGASDTINAPLWKNFSDIIQHNTQAEHIAGNGSIEVYLAVYDTSQTVYGDYDVIFNNPIIMNVPYDYSVNIPFDITYNGMPVFTDTFIGPRYLDYYCSNIFNGINIMMYFDQTNMFRADSVIRTVYADSTYPDSLMTIDDYWPYAIGARDMEIEWISRNDTIIPQISIEGYPHIPIPFDTGRGNIGYRFDNYVYFANTSSHFLIINDIMIGRTPNGRARLFTDSSEIPHEGDIWHIYTSGDFRMPLYGDTFSFNVDASTGIDDKTLSDIMSIKLSQKPCDNMLYLSITGNSEVDIVVYDITGRMVGSIFKGNIQKSMSITHRMDNPKGIYFIKDKLSDFSQKILILK